MIYVVYSPLHYSVFTSARINPEYTYVGAARNLENAELLCDKINEEIERIGYRFMNTPGSNNIEIKSEKIDAYIGRLESRFKSKYPEMFIWYIFMQNWMMHVMLKIF